MRTDEDGDEDDQENRCGIEGVADRPLGMAKSGGRGIAEPYEQRRA